MAGFEGLLAALAQGAPPHGGFAFGLDRLVWLVAGPRCAATIRDVIAFPKSAAGNEAMSGAPAEAAPDALRELHVTVR